ncbi:MAG: bis(5'-nucleosyl)-tetraphosphatase (symmetrical) YqeK [Microcoleus sp. PH2017_25_DOB_D_A]|uniref:bis(5'-nucleosyl)-tetraphosphatase (symmetrical) YqeK n=1 Tax=unclassified Microcoleus TaxID=2642155 RepID=UPI001D61AAA0|nr:MULTISPECIES: bis(5'-nucleosyl)-tetraphosphatase (symmetrical) YqeK [unclassified Microcoleus]MCC3432088.1 bis(5'-nucleosyl)-tetraphosphatase (symmetrical) YqeK [Microcoleus sp. PH2017_04_SCI_O_A]TAE11409.1 MAG: HD domain-containing protein [Oscillatoriales cyanobacterium]MCC3472609.1 bis(5'-nucleosyl)-tetraphosphatase (symmetrical) YqeK [Microcoleus sp. PH2017_13_LAR_U_A]MCC3485062.1 bis(5'-nucleosyl)-tetraphosphatase (symmetrical) YqeK [Microcoleus sp. PH2017_14_LAR_D_A]MCC3494138.1 bis(5
MTLALDREKVLAWLTQRVPAARITHILGVEQTAGDLARHYGLDEAKARSAGLLHDLAKYFKPQMLLQMAQNEGLELDSVLEAHPHLLHADASAIVARDEFGVVDREILDAIANHTLGRPNMSQLSCTVFIADTIEPSRGNTAELEALRETSVQNLYAAVWQTSDHSLKYLLETRCYIHPRTVLTRNWALQMARAQSPEIGNSTSKSIEQITS